MTDTASEIHDVRKFLYRDGALDPESARRLTHDALKNCDDGEIYLQYRASESFGFDDGRLKTADYSTDEGFSRRGVYCEMTGFAPANEISEAAIRRTAETMNLIDLTKLPPHLSPKTTNRNIYTKANTLELIHTPKK